jgi:hypothetical protein
LPTQTDRGVVEALTFDNPKITELVQKARPQSAPTKLSTREVFLMCFNAASMLLYVEHAGDIRLQPLGETHQELFVEFALLEQTYSTRPVGTKVAPSENSLSVHGTK